MKLNELLCQHQISEPNKQEHGEGLPVKSSFGGRIQDLETVLSVINKINTSLIVSDVLALVIDHAIRITKNFHPPRQRIEWPVWQRLHRRRRSACDHRRSPWFGASNRQQHRWRGRWRGRCLWHRRGCGQYLVNKRRAQHHTGQWYHRHEFRLRRARHCQKRPTRRLVAGLFSESEIGYFGILWPLTIPPETEFRSSRSRFNQANLRHSL